MNCAKHDKILCPCVTGLTESCDSLRTSVHSGLANGDRALSFEREKAARAELRRTTLSAGQKSFRVATYFKQCRVKHSPLVVNRACGGAPFPFAFIYFEITRGLEVTQLIHHLFFNYFNVKWLLVSNAHSRAVHCDRLDL